MIRIKPVTQLSNTDLNIQNLPTLPHPAKFTNYGEGLFVVLKAGQVIGFGSIQRYPHAPLTAGIAMMNHCYIIPTEQQKGYGTQLYRHLCQFAQNSFGLLQLNEDCPLYERTGGMIELG